MFEREGLIETLVISAFCGISYWLGKKDSQNEMIENIKELDREKQINDLKIEIHRLKKQNSIF